MFLTCIWFSGPAHRRRCRPPSWTRSSTRTRLGSCDWCRGAARQSSCSCYNPHGASCRRPRSVPASPHSRTARAAHTPRPAATGLDTHTHARTSPFYSNYLLFMVHTEGSWRPDFITLQQLVQGTLPVRYPQISPTCISNGSSEQKTYSNHPAVSNHIQPCRLIYLSVVWHICHQQNAAELKETLITLLAERRNKTTGTSV